MLKQKTVDLEDSNCALLGSDVDREVKKKSAETEPAWKGAGQKEGILVWRIEKFKVVKYEDFVPFKSANFYSGDSFIILHTYKEPEGDKLKWNLHFWLGQSTTQDEMGTAAYKTVELDTLLDDGPVQFREVEGHESPLFMELFPNFTVQAGGVDSGFRHVKPEEYVPRLLQVKGKGKSVKASGVECKATSLNEGDVFICDAGLQIYVWQGKASSHFEKRKAAEIASEIRDSRNGKAKSEVVDQDDEPEGFWTALGGKGEVGPATPDVEAPAPEPKLVRVSDASGSLEFKLEKEGGLARSDLETSDAFIVDCGPQIWVWIGEKASKQEKEQGMQVAAKYMAAEKKPGWTNLIKVFEGNENKFFLNIFKFKN